MSKSMPGLRTGRRKALLSRVRDEVSFLKNWAGNPLTTGAVAPSGKALARLMAGFVETDRSGRILELGPGTGVVTKAMLERGIEPDRIVSVEYSRAFVDMMRKRYPGVNVVRGDAYAITPDPDLGTDKPLATVISSLPLMSRPPADRYALVERALDMLEPGAPFIQFSYALVPPVKPKGNEFELDKTDWVVLNVPPARVWVYRRPA